MTRRLCLALLVLVGLPSCKSAGGSKQAASSQAAPPAVETGSPATASTQEVVMPSGLKYQDMIVGQGEEAVAGRRVRVNYTGWLTDGTQFDSSIGRSPFEFNLGAREVIPGWDQGVAGMREGGKRKLTVPADLGYGARGAGGVIPPGATLIFEVELLKVL